MSFNPSALSCLRFAFLRRNPRALTLLACAIWCDACGGHSSAQGVEDGGATAAAGSAGATAGSAGATAAAGSAGAAAGSAGATAGSAGAEAGNAGDAAVGDAGTLLLDAYGGPAGKVATDAPSLEPGVGEEQTCAAPVAAGACQLTSCRLGGIGSPGGGFGDFGPISASVGTTTVALSYDRFGYPTVDFPSSVALGTGGVMRFRGGNGSSVPKFDVSAIIPGLAVITSPVPAADGGTTLIDTSQDLSVTWVPISIGQIQFRLAAESTSIGALEVSVACAFEGNPGSGVVPHTLLSSLKEMSGTTPTYAFLSSERDATSVVNGLTIVTRGYQSAAIPAHYFSVTLQ